MTTKDQKSVKPLTGIAPWFGGKRILAKDIVKRINGILHTCYCEPFVGLGGVFFRRNLRPESEVINDLGGDVVNLFRVIKHHPNAFIEDMRYQLHSRAEFERLLDIDIAHLTDIQRAVRFYFLQRARYGGRPTDRCFPAGVSRSRAIQPAVFRRFINHLYDRLATVTIENMPFEVCIRRYDRKQTLFYLDPPYYGREDCYGKNLFGRADFQRLASLLSDIKGRFILSLNDVPEVRQIFQGFTIRRVSTLYRIAGTKADIELLISN